MVNVQKGKMLILTPDQANILREGQRKHQLAPDPKAPTIQKLLIQARGLKAQLDENPFLKRNALAKEIGMNPSYLTRVLRLAELAPEIQDYIMNLEPGIYPGPITESRIRFLARNPDPAHQVEEFHCLRQKKSRARYKLKVSLPDRPNDQRSSKSSASTPLGHESGRLILANASS